MITRNTCGRRGLLVPGLLLLLSISVPAFARSGDYYGPVYTSQGEIQVAQRVLLAEHFLKSGRYTAGRMDDTTIDGLRAFQRSHFIPDSGVLDHETMAQLMSHTSALGVARGRSQAATTALAQGTGQGTGTLRTMPETAGAIPLMTGLGALLMGGGLLLVRYRRS